MSELPGDPTVGYRLLTYITVTVDTYVAGCTEAFVLCVSGDEREETEYLEYIGTNKGREWVTAGRLEEQLELVMQAPSKPTPLSDWIYRSIIAGCVISLIALLGTSVDAYIKQRQK